MVQARRRFGQHFLEPAWVAKVIAAIDPQPTDLVIEVGPGRGALTLPLSARVARLVAVEIDRDLAAVLRRALPATATVVQGSVLDIDLAGLHPAPGAEVRLVGNLPYNVAVPIVLRILGARRAGFPMRDATLMLQREVADRLVARPGTRDYGPLAVTASLDAETSRLFTLPPGAFRPAPKVQSSLVRLRFGSTPRTVADVEQFERLVRGLFTHRRKTLANALRAFARVDAHEVGTMLRDADLDGGRRPETLHLAELARLAAVFASSVRLPVL